jgi:outer membrane receptor protein involved in Fe transport
MHENGPYRGIVGNRYRIGHTVDWNQGQRFLDQHFSRISELENVDRTYSVSLDDESIDYRASESVGAAFGMATVDLGRAVLIGGLRMERTETTYRGNESLFDIGGSHAGTRALEEGNDYLNFFPMAHLRYRLDDRTNLRLAWETQLDLTASYRVTREGSIFIEVNNLTNTPQTWYDGHPHFHYRSSYNQRWGLLGFRYGL